MSTYYRKRQPQNIGELTYTLYRHRDWRGSVTMVTDGKLNLVQHTGYYPYGEPWREPLGQPYLFEGKERMRDCGLNEYDFTVRRLYSPLCIWSAPDKMALQYSPTNPFVYCSGNPVKYIDPTGMIVEEGSIKEWNKEKARVISTRDKLQKKIANINSKAQKKNWNSETLKKKIGNRIDRVNSLNKTIDNLTSLEKSTDTYALKKIYSDESGVTYDADKDHIIISYRNTANFVHESTHAGQYEKGEIAFADNGNSFGQDVYDEIGAYKAQYYYSPNSVSGLSSNSSVKSVNDISASWVQNLIDSSGQKNYLPGTETNTGLFSVNINTGYEGLIKAYPQLERENLPKNIRLKDIALKYKH